MAGSVDSRTQLWTHHGPCRIEVSGCQFAHQVSQQQFGFWSFPFLPFMNVEQFVSK